MSGKIFKIIELINDIPLISPLKRGGFGNYFKNFHYSYISYVKLKQNNL